MHRFLGSLLVLLQWLPSPALAQTGPARGMLLVAEPALVDRNFERSVVLVLHHAEDGALGLILNRPTQVRAREALGNAAERRGYNEPIFFGGPVAPTAIAVLTRRPAGASTADASPAILAGVYVSSDLELLADPAARGDADNVRLFAGHAAWQAGQLEQEIARGAWRVAPGAAEHVFTPRPLQLWEDLNARQAELSVRLDPAAGQQPEPVATLTAPGTDALRLLR